MNKLPENLDLTVAQLCLSPQQLVLAIRHGAQDEGGKFEQREAYEAMQNMLTGRELRWVKVPFKLDETPFTLTINRVYEHDGNLFRIVLLTEEAMQHRSAKRSGRRVVVPTETDEAVLNISRYLVYLKTGTVVEKLYAFYHVVSPMQEIMEQYQVEVEAWDFSKVERLIKSKIVDLKDAMELADNRLPACTDEQKWVSNGVAYNCAMQCPSRGVCFQKRTEFNKLLAQARELGNLSGESSESSESEIKEVELVISTAGDDPAGVI